MFVFVYGMSLVLIKDALLYVMHVVKEGVKAYARARKRIHISFTMGILFVEVAAIMSIHELWIHLSLSGAVAAWETIVEFVIE